MNHKNKTRKKILTYLLIFYLIVSLPIVGVLVESEYLRFQFIQVITRWYSKIGTIDYVFIGNSLTAGGRNWSDKINTNPLNTINLAGNGYTIRQIKAQAANAIEYQPAYCFILAGTNDVFAIKDSVYSTHYFLEEYENTVKLLLDKKITPVVTLIPYQSSSKRKELIRYLNRKIVQIAKNHEVVTININPHISKKGQLLDKYTHDGVHFTKEVYDIWGKLLQDKIE